MNETKLRVGDRVEILLDPITWNSEGWFGGTVVRIEPYSRHRSFHWVELNDEAQAIVGVKLISVLNPKHIRKI
jgi:hypothetical protein